MQRAQRNTACNADKNYSVLVCQSKNESTKHEHKKKKKKREGITELGFNL